mgnify:CR=1 FL=1
MAETTPFLTHRQTVDALSFKYVRKGWRAGVRWLLYKLADWLDATEARIGIKDELDRNTTWKREMKLARWERERLEYFESLREFVRETMKRGAKADKHGNHRWKKALRHVNNVLIRVHLSKSPFAGKYAPAPGEDPTTAPGAEYCGTYCIKHPRMTIFPGQGPYCYITRVVSHSHRFRGCYVWFETDKDTGKLLGWHAWHVRCGWVSWGRSPAHAVKNLLRDWRYFLLDDRKSRYGTYTERELAKMGGWKLREICRKRGLPTSRRLDDMRNQLRGGQRSLMSLFG